MAAAVAVSWAATVSATNVATWPWASIVIATEVATFPSISSGVGVGPPAGTQAANSVIASNVIASRNRFNLRFIRFSFESK
jgi:hypothetical protein